VTITYVGYFADKTEFVRQDEPVKVILGDPAFPYGLWKSIEHMRRGEKALVTIKPKWGYRH
jgi:FKBP-type peptidyl-prolyl cis-trans isomerase 2